MEKVSLEIKDQMAWVTLNRPEKHNALDADVFSGLIAASKKIKKDRNIRGVILQGNGPSFCSGLDIPSFMKKGPISLAKLILKWPLRKTNLAQEIAWVWRELPIPVIAVVHGKCYGGGFQIMMAADFRIASPHAEFSIMESKWGMIPDMSGMVTFPEVAKIDTLKELSMTARLFSSEEALNYGLVSKVSNDPLKEALRLFEEIKQRSPDAVSATKKVYQNTWTVSKRKALRLETWYQIRLIGKKNWRIASKKGTDFGPRNF